MPKKKVTRKKTAKKVALKPPTKNDIYRAVAEKTDLPRRQVVEVCDVLTDVMVKSVKKYGAFNFLGLMKMTPIEPVTVVGCATIRSLAAAM